MSNKDDGGGFGGKTVIMPTPGGAPRREGGVRPLPELRNPPPRPSPGGTVVAPMPSQAPNQGGPFRGNQAGPFGAPPPLAGDPFAAPVTPQYQAPATNLVRPPGLEPTVPAAGNGFGVPPAAPDDWFRGAQGAAPPAFNAPKPPPKPTERIPLQQALNARDGVDFAAANPITAAAAPLLILLGRLRLQIVDMQAKPLMEHVFNSIVEFDKRIRAGGVSNDDARAATYSLCALADDIVQNLPGTDRQVWMQYSMLAQFFGVRNSGVGFFETLKQVIANPGPRYDLLELMHACLCLGFEGQYRSTDGGDATLQRVRRDVYQTLRHLRARSDDDISPRWRGLSLGLRKLSSQVPLWAFAAFAGAVLVGAFILLRSLLSGEADTPYDALLDLHKPDAIGITRAAAAEAPFVAPQPDVTQLQRIRTALGNEKGLSAELAGTDFITIRVSNLILFDSGKAVVKPQFTDAAQRIAAALNAEKGPIKVVGHTDNVKPRKTSRFKDNQALSLARAQAVEDVLAKSLKDPSRASVEGKGDTMPIHGNKTADQRAENRRVEIMLRREDAQ